MGMRHPQVAFAGRNHGSIVADAYQDQNQKDQSKRDGDLAAQHEPRLLFIHKTALSVRRQTNVSETRKTPCGPASGAPREIWPYPIVNTTRYSACPLIIRA